MDLSKLELMTTEALRAIQQKCQAVLATRVDNSLRSGTIVSFKDRDGSIRYLKVARVSEKSVSGVECDPVTFGVISTTKWRVGITLLTVVANPGLKVKPVQNTAPAVRPTAVPTTVPDDAW